VAACGELPLVLPSPPLRRRGLLPLLLLVLLEANLQTDVSDVSPPVSARGECRQRASAKRKRHENSIEDKDSGSDDLEEFWDSLPEAEDDLRKHCRRSMKRDMKHRTGPVSESERQGDSPGDSDRIEAEGVHREREREVAERETEREIQRVMSCSERDRERERHERKREREGETERETEIQVDNESETPRQVGRGREGGGGKEGGRGGGGWGEGEREPGRKGVCSLWVSQLTVSHSHTDKAKEHKIKKHAGKGWNKLWHRLACVGVRAGISMLGAARVLSEVSRVCGCARGDVHARGRASACVSL
jgi:hypothetical protein